MSRDIRDTPMIFPAVSVMGDSMIDTSITVPSLRIRSAWYGSTSWPLVMASWMSRSARRCAAGISTSTWLPIISAAA